MSIQPTATAHGSESLPTVDASQWRGRVCRFDGSEYIGGAGNHWRTFDRIDAGGNASYGDFTNDADGAYFLSDFQSATRA